MSIRLAYKQATHTLHSHVLCVCVHKIQSVFTTVRQLLLKVYTLAWSVANNRSYSHVPSLLICSGNFI